MTIPSYKDTAQVEGKSLLEATQLTPGNGTRTAGVAQAGQPCISRPEMYIEGTDKAWESTMCRHWGPGDRKPLPPTVGRTWPQRRGGPMVQKFHLKNLHPDH